MRAFINRQIFPVAAWLASSFIAFAVLTSEPAAATELSDRFAKAKAGSQAVVDHDAWTRLLKTYVVVSDDGINRVTYADFKRDGHQALKTYIKGLEATDVATLDRAELFAFWANLYNAKTIDVVLDAYPVATIKDIKLGGGLIAAFTGGPWKAKVTKVSGVELSLDDIEHEILRPGFGDPRVHYAVNCASIGCPNLLTEAFTGAKLEAQLDAGARAYINHARGISVRNGSVTASSIYDWFGKDFADVPGGVLGHAKTYAAPGLKRELENITAISKYGYDWSLNDASR
ncbi:MAG: DUF547 domain-containing protein [Hyphomicrobium sp.]|nr:MAG: DUF547 domain-containing protein [Hyphomicrobium sp.]